MPVTALCELAGIALLLRLAGAWGPGWLPASSLAVALFLYVPLFRYRGKGWPEWAMRIADGKRSAATLAGVLALGCGVYFLWLALPLPAFLRPGVAPPLAHPVSFVVHQAAVGLSEEVFFRGYLYDAFDRHGRRPLLPVSLLFAALHLAVFPTPWRALTFFPALLFGWARERTGNVYVPAALHFAFNLLPAFFGG
ncbi:MAG TPA: type II CAAX endopeptidase family protein [Candidatus Deferrimicrobiaceae bacterium]